MFLNFENMLKAANDKQQQNRHGLGEKKNWGKTDTEQEWNISSHELLIFSIHFFYGI